jgi:SAM-dependent methyltransferase
MPIMTERVGFYRSYIEHKGWNTADSLTPADCMDLVGRLSAGCRLLEIGFGRGGFLDWAKEQGAQTFGVEIIPELRERASAVGHVIASDLESLEGQFNLIVARDVLEHLDPRECQEMLAKIASRLAPGGRFVARFPNGQSPFAGRYQNGDITHVRALTPEAVRQLAGPVGLFVVEARNPRPKGRGLGSIKRRLAYSVRDLMELVIGYVYLGYRVPMDANVIVVLGLVQGSSKRL